MKVLLFGATGMIGQGVLRECLLDPGVASVVAVGRTAIGKTHPKLREIIHRDLADLAPIAAELADFDACVFCLGVSSAGMNEGEYRRITKDLTLAAARTLLKRNPAMTFIYVSGLGADSSEKGRVMWARVRGETENTLLAMPFKASYVFRPAFVRPMDGIQPKTKWLEWTYKLVGPLFPLVNALAPGYVTTTRQIGQAMLLVVRQGAPKRLLESRDIRALAERREA